MIVSISTASIQTATASIQTVQTVSASVLSVGYQVTVEVERQAKELAAMYKTAGQCAPVLIGMLRNDWHQFTQVAMIPVWFAQGFYRAFQRDADAFVEQCQQPVPEIEPSLEDVEESAIAPLTVFLSAFCEQLQSPVKTLQSVPKNSKEWRATVKDCGIPKASKMTIQQCQTALSEAGYVW